MHSLSTLIFLHIACAAASFSSTQISKVKSLLIANAHRSWEEGTATEALLELEAPELSVFGGSSIPPPQSAQLPTDALDILDSALASRPSGTETFVADSSAGDPASFGVADLIANWTTSNNEYATAAENELNFLLHVAPKSSSGIISHREEYIQFWSDNVYMVPPFLAYYGACIGGSNGSFLLQEAYKQIKGYRSILQDPDTKLWEHVRQGPWEDTGLWATGNGWAAAGMMRVLQTIADSSENEAFSSETDGLTSWIEEIINATWARQLPNGSLMNYFDDPNSFEDSSSTALLASVTFRWAVFTGDDTYTPSALTALQLLGERIDSDGWLTQVVDPYAFGQQGSHSPEGQAFVLLLDSAYNQWNAGAGTVNVASVEPAIASRRCPKRKV